MRTLSAYGNSPLVICDISFSNCDAVPYLQAIHYRMQRKCRLDAPRPTAFPGAFDVPRPKLSLEQIHRSPIILSSCVGVAGIAFPLLATWLEMAESGTSFGLVSIGALHFSSPLMLIIDTAPLVLGLCTYFASTIGRTTAVKMDRLQRYADSRGENLQQIIETCFDALITTGAGGVIENWNSAAERLFGYTKEEAVGKPLNLIDPAETRNGPRSVLSQASREHERCIVDSDFVSKDGRRFSASSSVGVLRTDDGQPTGLLAIVRDMTKQRQMEEALIRARDAAEAASDSKSRFLANMSHEIRTPMNGIIGMTQILLDTEVSDQQKDFLNTLHASAEQLSFVINDILDLSKLEADKLTIEKKPMDLHRLVRTTASMFETPTSSKGITMVTTVSDELPESVTGDYHRVKQVLINLLNNAVKFTDEGTVTLRARVARQIREEIVVAFEIEDTGCGMSEKQCAKIFAPFTQVDDSSTRAATGTGLGLSICKQLIEKMDGEIGVYSEAGKGSTFWFTLRTAASELLPEGVEELLDEADLDIGGSEILLVDDNAVNQKVATALLRGMDCSVDVAGNGREAVDAINAKRYDVVLMDVQMPVLDGFGATREVRSNSPHGDIPIIAMTARAMQGDREECLAAGMDDHLPKPVSKELLRQKIATWRGRIRETSMQVCQAGDATPTIAPPQSNNSSTGAPPAGVAPDPAPTTDAAPEPEHSEPTLDSGALQDLLSSMGDAGPLLIREIVDEFLQTVPAECAELYATATQGNIERVREIAHKMRSSTGNLGVRRMYAMCSELEERARSGNGDGMIERAEHIHSEFEHASTELTVWLAQQQSDVAEETAADAPAAAEIAAADYIASEVAPSNDTETEPDEVEVTLDPKTMQDLLSAMGDAGPVIIREIVDEFLQSVPEECTELGTAAGEGNVERVREIAHKMRSSTGNLGVRRMYTLCSELEERARSGNGEDMIDRAQAIQAEFERACAALRAWIDALPGDDSKADAPAGQSVA